MPKDIFDTLTQLDQERYRVALIHTLPENGPAMTAFCKKICKNSNGKYFDLLDHFILTPVLSEKIDSYNLEKLRELLIEQSKGYPLLVVDRADFLLDTWRKLERQAYFRFLTNQWDGFKNGMGSKLIFALQTSQEIEELQINDSQGQSRIFHLSEFNDIG